MFLLYLKYFKNIVLSALLILGLLYVNNFIFNISFKFDTLSMVFFISFHLYLFMEPLVLHLFSSSSFL